MRSRSPLGELARSYMDRGDLVPDEVTIRMVRERLAGVSPEQRVVYDGFPRTIPQARALSALLEELGRPLDRVVLLHVPREMLLARIAGRATCPRCHAVYGPTHPPAREGICDRCGAEMDAATRSDEAPEVVANRLDVYRRQTAPLVAHYRRRALLKAVDGTGSPDDVSLRIAEAVR